MFTHSIDGMPGITSNLSATGLVIDLFPLIISLRCDALFTNCLLRIGKKEYPVSGMCVEQQVLEITLFHI